MSSLYVLLLIPPVCGRETWVLFLRLISLVGALSFPEINLTGPAGGPCPTRPQYVWDGSVQGPSSGWGGGGIPGAFTLIISLFTTTVVSFLYYLYYSRCVLFGIVEDSHTERGFNLLYKCLTT